MSRARFYATCAAVAALIAVSAWGLRRMLSSLPAYDKLEEYAPSQTTRVFDSNGEIVAELSIEKRALLTLAEIPVDMQNAVIATEDTRFFQHWGVSPRSIIRAAWRNFRAGRVVEGASTLTQQLTKLIFLTPERKIVRKIKEMLLAIQLERNLSKEEILQLYLNQIYFGHGAYGVQAAAAIFFGKDVKDLTLAECALLAGMIKYPGGYSPFRHPDRALKRRAVILERMREEGFITAEEKEAALQEPLPAERSALGGIRAPYFVEYVRRQLEPKYGYNTLWRGGLSIHTTLDMRLQSIAEEEMEKALTAFDEKAKAEWERRLAEDREAGIEPPSVSTNPPAAVQAVFLLLDVKSGAVRAMIGGRGGEDRFNRAIQAQRQPGSTFKPFVFAAALAGGMTPMTLVEDAPLTYYYDGRDWRLMEGTTAQYAALIDEPFIESPDFDIWVPDNYDSKFLGVMPLRKALALSRNMTSVRLIDHVGPPKVVELARRVGIRSRMRPFLSLGLGSYVVTPLELANAFGAFANGGVHVEPFSVMRVEDPNERLLEQHVPEEKEALSPQTAYLVTSLLKVVIEGGTGRAASVLRRPLAGKTGTTNGNRDVWFIGYTPDLLALAWMGYDDFTPLGARLSAGNTVVPWWTAIMKRVLEDYPPRDFPVPEDIVFLKVDTETGRLALPTCPTQALQAFHKSRTPAEYCPFDHTQPLELKAEVGAPPEAQPTLVEPESAGAPEPEPGLPTDEELDRAYEEE